MTQIQVLCGFLIVILSILFSVRRANVKEKYLSTWIGFLLCPILGLFFQTPLVSLSQQLGFKVYSNFIFTTALIWLGLLTFQILISLSQAEKKIEILAEELALIKSDVND